MQRGTVGQILIDQALPESMRGRGLPLDRPNLVSLFRELAQRHPEKYRDVSKRLLDVGRDAATESGNLGFGPQHLQQTPGAKKIIAEIQSKLDGILADKTLAGAKRNAAIVKMVGAYQQPMMDTVYKESLEAKNPLALSVLSGARGNRMNLASLLGSDLLYQDHRGDVIPFPVLRSYSQGLSPAEYVASTYGARLGVVATKFATADAGFFGKQLNQAAHRLVVVDEDDHRGDDTPIGLPVDVTDPDSEGALLAQDVGPFKRNSLISPKMLKRLQADGHKRILIRSPMVGGSPDGGVYARDVGVQEHDGHLPGLGSEVGMKAAQSLAEPIAQGGLCLAEGTLVRMADWTVRPIEKVRVGEWVLGATKEGYLLPVRVTRVFSNGRKPCVSTQFQVASSREIVELHSTREHKLLGVARRWHPKTEIVDEGLWPVGEKCVRLCARMPIGVSPAPGRREPMALLLGLLLGDGCYTRSVKGIHLSCYDPSLIEHIQPMLASLGLRIRLLSGQRGYYRISQMRDEIKQDQVTGRMLPGARNPVLAKLVEMGFYGKYAHEKALPADIWNWDHESTLDLLAGLIATDGSVYTTTDRKAAEAAYIGFGSTSLRLIHEMRELLRVRFGIWPSQINANNSSNRKRTLYTFAITRRQDVKAFAEMIAERTPGVKRQKLREAASAPDPMRDTRYFYRKQQKAIGCLPTFDLEVDHPDHLFVLANGLIVSNSTKHGGGVAGQAKTVGGFDAINNLIQIPENPKGAAAHATVDGTVQSILPAPAGGTNVTIDGKVHYVSPDYELKVKPGDRIEAGDVISDGIPNPAIAVQYKGIGEGTRYFVHAFRDVAKSMGIKANRRNVELMGRALVNHVRLTQEYGDHVPDDVIPYSSLAHSYQPREGHLIQTPNRSIGMYLEKPVLHYSIGTRVRPSVVKDLTEFGVKNVTVHKDPPPFEPEMVRAMYSLHHDPDPITRMYGSGLKNSLLDAAHYGAVSDESSTSFVPGLAHGINFGKTGPIRVPGPDIKVPDVGMPKLSSDLFDFLDKLADETPAVKPVNPSGAGATPSTPPAPPKPKGSGFPAFQQAMDNPEQFAKDQLGPKGAVGSTLGRVSQMGIPGLSDVAKDFSVLTRGKADASGQYDVEGKDKHWLDKFTQFGEGLDPYRNGAPKAPLQDRGAPIAGNTPPTPPMAPPQPQPQPQPQQQAQAPQQPPPIYDTGELVNRDQQTGAWSAMPTQPTGPGGIQSWEYSPKSRMAMGALGNAQQGIGYVGNLAGNWARNLVGLAPKVRQATSVVTPWLNAAKFTPTGFLAGLTYDTVDEFYGVPLIGRGYGAGARSAQESAGIYNKTETGLNNTFGALGRGDIAEAAIHGLASDGFGNGAITQATHIPANVAGMYQNAFNKAELARGQDLDAQRASRLLDEINRINDQKEQMAATGRLADFENSAYAPLLAQRQQAYNAMAQAHRQYGGDKGLQEFMRRAREHYAARQNQVVR